MNTSTNPDPSAGYYVVERGQKKGPLTLSGLETMRQDGALTQSTLLWIDGMADWEPASKVVPQMFFHAVTNSSIPGTEQVTLKIARPKWRFLAGLIDLCVLLIPTQIVIFILALPTAGAGLVAELGVPFFLPWINGIYSAVTISTSWQGTVGMKLLGLKAVDSTGRKPSLGQCWGRGAASVLSWIVFGIGYFILFFTERRQTMHDLMAGTLVVRPK
jgi:uncharacterized RDD family membrane protein YckC